jgi:hypothetical protein
MGIFNIQLVAVSHSFPAPAMTDLDFATLSNTKTKGKSTQ